MRILLLGEYSNVHATLAKGLKALGHQVTVVSNGDFFKNYPRDISLIRKPGRWGGFLYMLRLYALLPRLRGYDVVQLVNPMFLELKAGRIFPVYRYLRKHNRRVFLGGFGMDYYWVSTCCTTMPLRYSDFNIGKELRQDREAVVLRNDWIGTTKQRLNEYIAHDCDGIITGLYEYWVCYHPAFPQKTTFIPYPIDSEPATVAIPSPDNAPLRIFIGINRERSAYKGTDIMLRAANDILARYPEKMQLTVVESLPFEEYQRRMEGCDAILDQLYAYTPSMNALLAMSKGIIVIGGGEPEPYELIHEQQLRPVVNVLPTYESVCHELEQLILHPERVAQLKRQSIGYVRKYHNVRQVAQRYLDFYNT